jgi:hypothetical protein
LENAVQLGHPSASIVVLEATAGTLAGCGGSKVDSTAARSGGSATPEASDGSSRTVSNVAFDGASITALPDAGVTDDARAAGGSIA